MRRLVGDLFADLRRLEERIREVTLADDNPWYRRIGCDRRTCRNKDNGCCSPQPTTIQSQFPTAMA